MIKNLNILPINIEGSIAIAEFILDGKYNIPDNWSFITKRNDNGYISIFCPDKLSVLRYSKVLTEENLTDKSRIVINEFKRRLSLLERK